MLIASACTISELLFFKIMLLLVILCTFFKLVNQYEIFVIFIYPLVSGILLFKVKVATFHQYHGEIVINFDEMMIMSPLY